YYTPLHGSEVSTPTEDLVSVGTRDAFNDLIVNPGPVTIHQAAHPASNPEALNVNGNIRLLAPNSKITGSTGLILEETGDTLGTMRLSIVNRFQQAGALFEQLATGPGKGVADFIFKPDVDQPALRRNLRLEARPTNDFVQAPEFQIGAPDDPTLVVADNNSAFRKGKLGIGTTSPSAKLD